MEFYVLNQNEQITATLSTDALGDNTPVYSATVDEKLGSYDVLELSIPSGVEHNLDIKEEYYIVFNDVKGFREYIITEVIDEDDGETIKTITAELSSVELLDEIIQTNLTGNNPATILTNMLVNTRWTIGNVDPSIYNSTFSEETEMVSVLEGINLLSSSFKAEVSFSYAVAGNKITKRFVNLHKQMGANNGKRFEVDKDVTSIKRTIDTSSIKTAIIPFGAESEGKARLNIKNLVWSKAAGNPVDKPLGQDYIGDPSALTQWGKNNSDGNRRHRFIAQEINVETASELASMAWVQLGQYTSPKTTYEAKAIDLYTITGDEDLKHEYVNLGDTVVITDYYFAQPLVVQSRVSELKRDLLEPLNNDLVFGDSLELFSTSAQADRMETIKKELSNRIEFVRLAADGKSDTYLGSVEPISPNEKDIWYRPHPTLPNETQFLIFNGLTWDIILDTSNLDSIGKEVEEAIEQIEIATQSANDAVTKADQAIEDAGFAKVDASTAKSNAVTAISTAQTALSNSGESLANSQTALSAYNNLEIGGRNLLVNSQYIELLPNDTGWGTSVLMTDEDTPYWHTTGTNFISTYQSDVYDWMNANCVVGESYTIGVDVRLPVAGTVIIEQESVSKAIDTANVWKRVFHTFVYTQNYWACTIQYSGTEMDYRNWKLEDGNQGTAWSPAPEDVQVQITDINGELSWKVAQTTFDTLQGTVTGQSTLISQSQTAIALKADSSLVNTVKSTVDTHTTQIKATSDGLALKAESSLVNTINGTVNTHTGQISANSTAINARLTSAQVDSLVGAKNYVNQTTLNATSSGLSGSITQVATDLSNLEISDRNLIVNGSFENGLSDWAYTPQALVDSSNAYDGSKCINISATNQATSSFPGVWQRVDGVMVGEEYTLSFAYKSRGDSANDLGFFARLNWYDVNNANISFIDLNISSIGPYMYRINSMTEKAPVGAVSAVIRINYRKSGAGYIDAVKFQKGNKATAYSPAFEDMATLEKFTTLNATVDGIQTTVGTKASQTQVTQLAGQITTKVESSTYNSKMTQLDSSINLRLESSKVISQINISTEGILLQGKRIQLDGDVTMTTAFVGKIKAIDLVADRITTGTLNASNVNIINLNANKIATGTITGVNSSWNLNTGSMEFKNPSSGDVLNFTQGEIDFQNGSQGRHLQYNAEGLKLVPFSTNTGTSLNTSLYLVGGGNGSYQYIQFLEGGGNNYSQRLEAEGGNIRALISNSGSFEVRKNSDKSWTEVKAGRFTVNSNFSGATLSITAGSLETERYGNRSIRLMPTGTGKVEVTDGTYWWNVKAKLFETVSSRTLKSNIEPFCGNGLDVINGLQIVTYNMKQELEQGIVEEKVGLISEDSPMVSASDGLSIDMYKTQVFTMKAIQEMSKQVQELNEKIKLLESGE